MHRCVVVVVGGGYDAKKKRKKEKEELSVFGTIPDFHSVQMLGGGGCVVMVTGLGEGSAYWSRPARVRLTGRNDRR